MGAYLDKPKREKLQESGEANGVKYGVACMQGWREDMEDSHVAKTQLPDSLSEWSYFAVFDGHGGSTVSAYCAEHLLKTILARDEFKDDVPQAVISGCLDLDNIMRLLPDISSEKDSSGSTAVFTFISPNTIYIANCGDSRAVICRNGGPVFSTRDHTGWLASEEERIVNAGGWVSNGRVTGNLAVSRALGDFHFKRNKDRAPNEQLVSNEPEVFTRERHHDDEFLVLACDGVWDVMTNDDLCSFIHSRLLVTKDLQQITSQVIDTCLYKGSKDNMSIVLVVFPGAPTPTPEAIAADKELDEKLHRKLKELVPNGIELDYHHILQEIKYFIPDEIWPPGGGLESKRVVIDNAFKVLCPSVEIDKSEYIR